MVVMQLPDGSTCEYGLRATKWGLRLVRSCVSYDLLTLVRDAGWTIRDVKTDIARRRLAQVFGITPRSSAASLPARQDFTSRTGRMSAQAGRASAPDGGLEGAKAASSQSHGTISNQL